MRERIELVGGALEIDSQEGAGSCVTARVPLPEAMKSFRRMARNGWSMLGCFQLE